MIDSPEFAEISSGRRVFFAISVLNYKDVFDSANAKPHYARGCAKYMPLRKGFAPCITGNDIDNADEDQR
jgi:hypothetical protein